MIERAPAPMEALLAAELPTGPGWQYEPKWDGFRCLAVRDGASVELWSKSGKPLARYFPEVAATIGAMRARRFTIDGELLIATGGRVAFDALQMRLHPAASRIARLARETPAMLVAFDLLAAGARSFEAEPLADRRATLATLLAAEKGERPLLSPATDDPAVALGWLERTGGALDGVIAKRLDEAYRSGERAMIKIKPARTADCVVGGFRHGRGSSTVASLLLGLYDKTGLLHHVGFTSAMSAGQREQWTRELTPLIASPGFTGNAPGGPSRWATDRSADWFPVEPRIVVEVAYDQVTAGRFRHGTRLLRRRPDKSPAQCTCDQLAPALTPAQVRQLIDSAR